MQTCAAKRFTHGSLAGPQPKRSASIAHAQASTACFVFFFFPVMSCVLHSSGALFQLSLVLVWGRTLVGMRDAPTHQVPTELWKKRHVLFHAGKDWKYMKSRRQRSQIRLSEAIFKIWVKAWTSISLYLERDCGFVICDTCRIRWRNTFNDINNSKLCKAFWNQTRYRFRVTGHTNEPAVAAFSSAVIKRKKKRLLLQYNKAKLKMGKYRRKWTVKSDFWGGIRPNQCQLQLTAA